MHLGFLVNQVKISPRKLVVITILASTSLAWSFFMVYAFENIFKSYLGNSFWAYTGFVVFLSFGAISAVVGSVLSEKIDRRKLLILWITLGVVSSATLAIFQGTIFLMISSVLLGLSLALGYPSFTSLFADCTVVEERARISGVIVLLTFVLVIVAVALTSIYNDLLVFVAISILLRSMSYIPLVVDPCQKVPGKLRSWRSVLGHRDFSYYLYPWLLFNVAAGLTVFMFKGLPPEYESAVNIGDILHYLGAGFVGFIAGFVADRFGRKQPIVIGLVVLGISFAFLGFAMSPASVLVHLAVSGAAWGFLIVVYMALPGDLSVAGSREKFYALGIAIPLIVDMGLVAASDLTTFTIPSNYFSPILSILLFLSVILVWRAREVLPDKTQYERRMKEYVDKVGKEIEKSKKS